MGNRYIDERGRLQQFALIRDVIIGIIALVFVMWVWPLRQVPTGHRGVITLGGEIRGIKNEGFLVVWPWENLSIFSIRAEEATVENAEGSTSDTQPVKVSLTVRYSIQPNRVAEVYEKYSRDGDLQSYVQTATQEVFKAVTSKFTAPSLIAERSKVSSEIVSGLRQKLATYGAQVINVDMRNFSFSNDYMAAINEKVTQEQKRMAAENKFKTVEAEQKQKVAVAEAEATALKAKADGEAYAQLKAAQAQAESIRIQNVALSQGKEVLELRRIEVDMQKAKTWDGKLPQNIYAGAPIPFFTPQAAK